MRVAQVVALPEEMPRGLVQVEGNFDGLAHGCRLAIRPQRRLEAPRADCLDCLFVEPEPDTLSHMDISGTPVRSDHCNEFDSALILRLYRLVRILCRRAI